MHVIICGGRETHLSVQDYAWLGTMHREEAFTLVITGGAPGVDTDAHRWAYEGGIDTLVAHAHWQDEGKAAGPRRNARMLAYLKALSHAGVTQRVIAFPGGAGTRNMMQQAEHAGVIVIERLHLS